MRRIWGTLLLLFCTSESFLISLYHFYNDSERPFKISREDSLPRTLAGHVVTNSWTPAWGPAGITSLISRSRALLSRAHSASLFSHISLASSLGKHKVDDSRLLPTTVGCQKRTKALRAAHAICGASLPVNFCTTQTVPDYNQGQPHRVHPYNKELIPAVTYLMPHLWQKAPVMTCTQTR